MSTLNTLPVIMKDNALKVIVNALNPGMSAVGFVGASHFVNSSFKFDLFVLLLL